MRFVCLKPVSSSSTISSDETITIDRMINLFSVYPSGQSSFCHTVFKAPGLYFFINSGGVLFIFNKAHINMSINNRAFIIAADKINNCLPGY